MNDNAPDVPSDPTARTMIGDVEVWDLRGKPSAHSLGFPDDSSDASYETQEPRTVRFTFPDGVELTTEATLISFYRSGRGDDADFTVGVRTAQLEPDALVTTYRHVLVQLGVSEEPVDQLAAEISAAPDDQTERISVGSDEVTLGSLTLGGQAGMAPIAGSGRVIIGGSWQKG